ncbi:hypothetical protein PAAG_04080 [Paracoccidioides lutzii Pb01]|uniref:Uncharacterized protein n=1 Tax=Paracoccidioides lutzii (strain ATCC MYA-826 / Pb01) TaxID=502779 RepID=C1GZY6_PARBA|nr:hypothetical protein PAAG_04080 [Paracoccidioides lutzii Pb01]EEH33027.1 hypothetical protein PAAG_04080 [Paracoccidioides lutzii Pb01]
MASFGGKFQIQCRGVRGYKEQIQKSAYENLGFAGGHHHTYVRVVINYHRITGVKRDERRCDFAHRENLQLIRSRVAIAAALGGLPVVVQVMNSSSDSENGLFERIIRTANSVAEEANRGGKTVAAKICSWVHRARSQKILGLRTWP